MPTLELAAGQVVTAAHTNTYWMRQVIATGLSSARPTGYQGRAVYDTDTHRLMIYASATTGWRARGICRGDTWATPVPRPTSS